MTTQKTDWLKATRTVGGHAVRHIFRVSRHSGDYYLYAGEVQHSDGEWVEYYWKADGAWASGGNSTFSLSAGSIPSAPEAVCDDEEPAYMRQTSEVIDHYSRSHAPAKPTNAPRAIDVPVDQGAKDATAASVLLHPPVLYPMYAPVKSEAEAHPHVIVDAPAKPVMKAEPPDQRALAAYLLKRDAEIFEALKESEMRDAQKAETEWKVGDKCEWRGGTDNYLFKGELLAVGPAYCLALYGTAFHEVATCDLHSPAPKTRDVVKQVWLYREWTEDRKHFTDFVTNWPCSGREYELLSGPLTITFPAVPVGKDE